MKTNSKYTACAAVVLSLGLTACGDQTKVSVTDASGMAIANATVSMDGNTVYTDELGSVTIARPEANKVSTLAIEADGYITQSIEIGAASSKSGSTGLDLGDIGLAEQTTNSISATLKAKNPVQKIDDISKEGSITAADGSIFVDFTPDSFVTADGKPATGAAEVSITPWNPTNADDMAAFLGEGYAQDLQGEMGQLLSYGAMTVQFTQNGEKLQLAQDKKATISMPLSFNKDYDGTDMQVGDTIPMWHFDESKGFWVEEGEGQVITDDKGALMLTAEVAHFTTWNWDMKFDNPATAFVQCQLPDVSKVACSVKASIKYNDKITTTRTMNVPSTGADIVNIDPNLGSIVFTAEYYDDAGNKIIGSYTSKGLPTDDVIIKLDKTLENISVKCQLPNGTDVSCILKTDTVNGDGSTSKRTSSIPNTGAKIVGIDPAATNFTFDGTYYDFANGMKYFGNATASSLPSDEVVIVLDKSEAIGDEDYLTQFDTDTFISIERIFYADLSDEPVEVSILTPDQYRLIIGASQTKLLLDESEIDSNIIDKNIEYQILFRAKEFYDKDGTLQCSSDCLINRIITLYPEKEEIDILLEDQPDEDKPDI